MARVLAARWVFPLDAPPIEGGAVALQGPKIAAVCDGGLGSDVRHLGDVAILPGLVNAHTHLEFSELATPIGSLGISLPQWIPQVVAHRAASAADTAQAIARGLAESIAAGTTAIGEIATSNWFEKKGTQLFSAGKKRAASPFLVAFREWVGPTRERAEAALQAAKECLLETSSVSRDQPRPGLSPHAPYSVHPALLAGLVELGQQFDVPLAMHLAESREELELLRDGSGPLRDVLEQLGAWEAAGEARYSRIADYLEQLVLAPRSLIIHGNYLDQQEIEFLAEQRQRMNVVYCPRTHTFFRHEAYPLAERIAAGVSMALGTDSRASNPNLSLWEEMQFVAAQHSNVDPRIVLELGTLGGARALGLADRMGSIAPGKLANLTVVGPIDRSSNDPYECLFAPQVRVVQSWIHGQLVYDAKASR